MDRTVDRMNTLVVVSGMPGSGKTQLGGRLAARLGWELLDKDDFLERLFDTESGQRIVLSRLADEQFKDAALASAKAVAVSFWRRNEWSASAGTPTEWLRNAGLVLEIHCSCSPETAATRFMRRTRHSRHGDEFRSAAELLAQGNALGELGPLNIGPTMVVDTESIPDLDPIIIWIDQARLT